MTLNTRQALLGLVAALAILSVSARPSSATLIGDTVFGCLDSLTTTCTLPLDGTDGQLFDTGQATVSSTDVEFSRSTSVSSQSADFDAASLTIVNQIFFAGAFGTTESNWYFADLDWVGMDGIITNVTLQAGNTMPIDSIAFGPDSITIVTPDYSGIGPAIFSATFAIEATHAPIPEPSALALLAFGLAVLGLAAFRRKPH